MDNNVIGGHTRTDTPLEELQRPENKALHDCSVEEMYKELAFRVKGENDKGVAIITSDEVGVEARISMSPFQQRSCVLAWIHDLK